MAHTLTNYATEYQQLFDSMTINKKNVTEIDAAVKKINAGKTRYMAMETQTGVPWFIVGLIHYMEASCNFSRHLHNGDSLTRRTVNVPAGRPVTGAPPFTWEESALDALKYKKLTNVKNWSLPQMLFILESFNGFGYRTLSNPIHSPYLWSYSNHYTKGKYIADGKYSPTQVSKQAGAAVILHRVMEKNNLLSKYAKAAAAGSAAILIIAAFFF